MPEPKPFTSAPELPQHCPTQQQTQQQFDEGNVFKSPQGWTDVFMLASFAMACVVLFGGLRRALRKSNAKARASTALREVLVFGVFVLMFWSLESYAHYRAPYYAYSTSFRDGLPRLHYFEHWVDHWPKLYDCCTDIVRAFANSPQGGKIPLSVVLLEASLTYASLWTAKLLRGPAGAQPIFAGLVLVTVDALLDPIVAMGHVCGGKLSLPTPATGNGIGLWHWYTPTARDFVYACPPVQPWQHCEHPLSGVNTLAPYFHIPIFNYAAWLGAPIILVAIVNLIGPARRDWLMPRWRRLRAKLKSDHPLPSLHGKQVALLAGVLLPLVVVIRIAPAQDPTPQSQYLIIGLALLLVVGIFIHNFGEFHAARRFDAAFALPVAIALIVPAVVGLATGQFVAQPLLMPVAVIALNVGLWLAWLPYRRSLKKIAALVGTVDRFTRVHYFGFTSLLVLLGASHFENKPGNRMLLGLLLVAACFHVFAYVTNDVIDLPVDRGNALRRNDPLVSKKMEVGTALALALTTIPIAILTTLLLLRFRLLPSLLSLGVLALAHVLMVVYNLQGKRLAISWSADGQPRRLRLPLVTDLVQGLAWGALAPFGALVGAAAEKPKLFDSAWAALSHVLGSCWILAAYGAGFIFLINGIHGGLRDLRSDQAAGRHTTAMVLGARVDPDDPTQVLSSVPVMVFAHGVHLAMFGLVVLFLHQHTGPDDAVKYVWQSRAMTAVTFVISLAVLHGVVAIRSPKRNDWVSWGVFVLLIPPIGMFWFIAPAVTAFKVAVTLCFVVPLALQQDHMETLISMLYEDGGIKGRCGRLFTGKRKDNDKNEPMAAAALAGTPGVSVDESADD